MQTVSIVALHSEKRIPQITIHPIRIIWFHGFFFINWKSVKKHILINLFKYILEVYTPVCCLLAAFFLLLVAPKVRTRMSGFGRGSGCSCSWNAETTFHLHLPAPPPAPLPSFPVICCISNATADCCGNVCALAALVPAMICLCLHFGLWVPLSQPLPLALMPLILPTATANFHSRRGNSLMPGFQFRRAESSPASGFNCPAGRAQGQE